MRYGKRIRNGANGDVQWCELTADEVSGTLHENVALNAEIYRACVEQALAQRGLSLAKKEDAATLAANPRLERDISETARALFDACAVRAFIALQERLAEKTHFVKANHLV
jgi:hypothetical protein